MHCSQLTSYHNCVVVQDECPFSDIVSSQDLTMQVRTTLPDLTPSRDNKEMVLEVGRWGEELVYRFLQASQGPASDWHIQWMNADFNTATPYDLHLV